MQAITVTLVRRYEMLPLNIGSCSDAGRASGDDIALSLSKIVDGWRVGLEERKAVG